MPATTMIGTTTSLVESRELLDERGGGELRFCCLSLLIAETILS